MGDIFTWDCVVCGLPDTMFEMGIFELTLTFTTNYPFQAPIVRFITDIFHPNISPAGILPLDHWTPAMDVTELLSYIQCLLSEPDLSSVVNQEAARLYREDRREFVRRVERVIERSLDTEETPGKISTFMIIISHFFELEGSRSVGEPLEKEEKEQLEEVIAPTEGQEEESPHGGDGGSDDAPSVGSLIKFFNKLGNH